MEDHRGSVISAAAQLPLGVAYYGIEPLRNGWKQCGILRSVLPELEPSPYQTHCLRTFWSMLVPWEGLSLALYVASALFILVATIALWKRRPGVPLPLRFAALLLATVLVSPHLTVYDLVILAPAILLLTDWLIDQSDGQTVRGMETLLYLVYVLPLLGPITRFTHIQLSVVVMSAVILMIWRMPRERGTVASPTATI